MNPLIWLGEAMRGLQGWRRALLALLLGAVSATAFAPFNFFPALLLGLAGLALLLDGADLARRPWLAAAVTGWCFFFGQFLVGLHWIAYPFLVDPDAFLWLLPFAVTLMPAGLALFGMLAALLVVACLRRRGTARLIALAVALAIVEWLRGHILTGFPWNLPAYGWGALPEILQGAALVGAYGLSLLTLLLGVSLAGLANRNYALPAVMLLLFAGLWGFGAFRLQQGSTFVPGVSLRLVQPNIPQAEVHQLDLLERNWNRLVQLSARPGQPTLIVWPEAAAIFTRGRIDVQRANILALTQRAVVMTGYARRDLEGRAFNSLAILGAGGRSLGIYDKHHLVPFGEYLPLAPLLGRLGIAKLTVGMTGFSAGDGPHAYDLPGAPAVTPLICYEAIFPGAVTSSLRPGWLVNVTDDSWFGPWAGPNQHLLITRMRAIEEGLPIARAANTGISAVIDPRGRIVASLGLDRTGVVDAGLPAALPPTPYARFGNLGFAIILLVSATIAALLSQRRRLTV